MPPAIIGASGGIFGGAITDFIFSAVINAAISIGIAKLTRAFDKKPVKVLQKVDVEYVGGLEPRRKLYGYFRASGLHLIPAITTGLTGTRVHKAIAISDGQIEAVDAVWFNNDRIVAADFAGGPITAGKYAGHSQIFVHLGLASQTADSAMLAMGVWTTEHRGDGVAYVYTFFDASNEVFPQGAPTLVAEGRGALCYDPRLDTSPGANPDNLAYWAFTTRPPLILADFLRWGAAEIPANIIWSEVVTAANVSDEDVAIPGSTTQKRFSCSVEVNAPQTLAERDETIKMLARAMMGSCWNSEGKWHMRAGVYSSPVGSVVDDDFLSGVLITTAKPRSGGGIFNTVRGSYVDQAENAQPKSFPEVGTAAYVTEDGETIYTDASFPTARTVYEAERNAILLVRQARRRIGVEAIFKFKTRKFQVYDVVNVTCAKMGWVAQPARIVSMSRMQNFTNRIKFQEIASSDFTDPDVSDYLTPNAISVPESAAFVPGAARNLAATSTANGIIFTWDAPLNAPPGVLYRLFEYTSSTPFSSAIQIGPDTPQTSLVVPKSDTTLRYYWVVAVDPLTLSVSAQAPPSNGVPGSAATASAGLAAIVYPGSAVVDGYTASLTTPTVAITPTGGTAPYTYATTFTSGGSGISINNGTTAAPSFTAAGLAEGDVKSGTARIRVTDNVSATYDVFVTVTITRLFGITLVDTTVNATGSASGMGTGGSPAVASYTVANSGAIYWSPGSTYGWLNPAANPADYDVRFTLNSGSISSGTVGSWLSLGTSRQVIGVRTPSAGAGTSTQNITVEIRLHATLAVLATKTLIMNETIV